MSTEHIADSAAQQQFATQTVPSPVGDGGDAITPSRFDGDSPPVRWPELLCLLATIVLWDVSIYHGGGFAGWALVLIATPVLLAAGIMKRHRESTMFVLLPLLALLALRMLWCGSTTTTLVGMGLLVAAAMAIAGIRPYLENWGMFLFQIPGSTLGGLGDYGRSVKDVKGCPPSMWMTVGLPMLALGLFATIFLRANPTEWTWLGNRLGEIVQQWQEYFPTALEVGFWLLVGGIAIAWLRPGWVHRYLTRSGEQSHSARGVLPTPLYQGYRNTLVTVIALFGAYLGFEYHTLWFREFPEGFHYSGYSHEGAFWLTVALALATLMLSTIFQGATLNHPSIGRLKSLAWIWSGLNLLLAAAVFHRLFIYIDFNGMTRMRVVAMLGVAAVIAGFALVLAKIIWNKSFLWLFRRQIWAVSLAAYLFVVLPVDFWVNQYNVRQVLSGNLAPSVQIAMHPTSSEGLLQLSPLLDCDDEVIREGVGGMLALRLEEFQQRSNAPHEPHWSEYQLCDERLRSQLAALSNLAGSSTEEHRRTVQAFKDYAYQWW